MTTPSTTISPPCHTSAPQSTFSPTPFRVRSLPPHLLLIQLTTRVRPFHLLQNILPLKFNTRILPYLHSKTILLQSNKNKTPTLTQMEMVPIPDNLPPSPTYQQFQMVTRASTLKRRRAT